MVLDTTACQRVKVKATSVCRGPDTGQKVSVRVRTPGDPKSALTVACCTHGLPSLRLAYFGGRTALILRVLLVYKQALN